MFRSCIGGSNRSEVKVKKKKKRREHIRQDRTGQPKGVENV